MRIDFLATKGPLVPSNSTICPRNGPKRRQKVPKTAQCAPAPRNQERAVSWATWLKVRFRGHLVHPQPPTFYSFQASESPNETRRPPYEWSLGAAGGPASPRTVGANGGSTRVPGAKKRFFPKLFLDHLGGSNKCFWAILSPWWRVLGHGKSQNALKMGRPKNCAMCTITPKPRTGRILGYVAPKRIPRAPSPPATPHFL